MDTFEIDKLKLYRGEPFEITNGIEIHVPSLSEICEYGENNYYGMIHTLCAVGIDLCWQLEEIGIPFDKISDYDLFREILSVKYTVDDTRIIFGNKLDLSKMKQYQNEDGSIYMIQNILVSIPLRSHPWIGDNIICNIPIEEEIKIVSHGKKYSKIKYRDQIGYVLNTFITETENQLYMISQENDVEQLDGNYENIIIDEKIYLHIASCLRNIHGLKRDDRIAGNNSCRMAFIEDAKMEYEALKYEPKKSMLLQWISTLTNIEGFKRNDKTVWDMNIYAFMDSVKRIARIRNSSLLLQSGYSGFGIDLNKIKNKNELDYMGELD